MKKCDDCLFLIQIIESMLSQPFTHEIWDDTSFKKRGTFVDDATKKKTMKFMDDLGLKTKN